MSYFVPANPTTGQISQAINYALANLGGSVASNLQSGQIVSNGITTGYLYQYMDIAYAQSFDGSVGFSTSPTNATYFGVRNTSSTTVSTNPTDYVWYQVAGGFGTTKFLWYNVTGGRNIQFAVQATAPAGYYVLSTTSLINLDIITSTLSVNANIAIIYQWTNGPAPLRPTTTSTYTWSTNTFSPVPSGWASSLPSNTTPGAVLWEIQVPISANVTVPTSLVDWTNTSYPIVATAANGATGPAGSTGASGSNGLNAIYAYLVQNQSLSPPTFSSTTSGATAPSGWSLTPPTGSYIGQVFWYIFGQYNPNSITVNGVPANTTSWTGPTAASVFEDIESDNWNGSVPPTYGTPSTYGTTGYYISRSTGDVYFNNGLFRGNVQTGSTPPVIDSTNHTISSGAGSLINSTGTFALGTTSQNIVNDGTGVYLNGFVYGNGSAFNNFSIASTGFTTLMPVSGSSFTLTKSGNVIVSSTGRITINTYASSASYLPNLATGDIEFDIYSGSTFIASTPVYFTNPIVTISSSSPYNGITTVNYTFTILLNLTAGSYLLYLNNTNLYGNLNLYQNTSSYTSTNVTSHMTSIQMSGYANSFWYQIG